MGFTMYWLCNWLLDIGYSNYVIGYYDTDYTAKLSLHEDVHAVYFRVLRYYTLLDV